MLCVEDYLDALDWAEQVGGLERADWRAPTPISRSSTPSSRRRAWIGHLAKDPATRSNTSVCLSIVDPDIAALDADAQAAFAKGMVSLLDAEGVAYDIGAYRDAPPGLRIWAGATVETADLEALMPWLDWAFATQKAALQEGRLTVLRRSGRRGGRMPSRFPFAQIDGGHHGTPRTRFRQAVADRRPDLQGPRRRGRLPAGCRQGQGEAARDHRRL